MKPIVVERTISATPQQIFPITTNVEKWAEIVPAIDRIEMLTPGPVAVGTTFRETRTMMGREATEEMTFLELEAPTKYVLGAESHGCRYRTEFELIPVDDGTTLRMTFGGTPLTTLAKVMAFLMKPMAKKLAEMCGRDLDAIKAHVEAAHA
ncbi:MAG: SRPBCC family protein [Planctomycetota bacterium]